MPTRSTKQTLLTTSSAKIIAMPQKTILELFQSGNVIVGDGSYIFTLGEIELNNSEDKIGSRETIRPDSHNHSCAGAVKQRNHAQKRRFLKSERPGPTDSPRKSH